MEPEIIKRLRSGESLHDNPNFSGSDGEEIVAYVDRITAALAEKDSGWMPIENGGFTYLTVNKQDISLRFRNFCKTPAHATHWMPELPLPESEA